MGLYNLVAFWVCIIFIYSLCCLLQDYHVLAEHLGFKVLIFFSGNVNATFFFRRAVY